MMIIFTITFSPILCLLIITVIFGYITTHIVYSLDKREEKLCPKTQHQER